jgi:hydroxymethylpyrimidine/phosphomethylpyrimidine kinase
MSRIKRPLLSIAGYDPTGGAGVLLDAAVFRRFGFPGMAIITAVTVQNTQGVRAVSCLRVPSLWSQYRALAQDVPLGGIKVGMLGCGGNVSTAARILKANQLVPRVLDPVLRSSSGKRLLPKEDVSRLAQKLRGRLSVLTPNLDEARALAGGLADGPEGMSVAAERIAAAFGAPCVVKGGHLARTAVNILYDGRRSYIFEREKLWRDVHGTGCFFSSALLSLLASGDPLVEAVRRATDLTHEAIRNAIGPGRGRLVISPRTLGSPD